MSTSAEVSTSLISPLNVVDGLPDLEVPVVGHVHVTRQGGSTVVAVFVPRIASKWWDPFTWGDHYLYRDGVEFGCGMARHYHEGWEAIEDGVLRAHIRHNLLKSWATIAEVLDGVLDAEQRRELRNILEEPHEATRWGPWMTAIETGAEW